MFHKKRLITLLSIWLISTPCLAANKIYIAPETPVVFANQNVGAGSEAINSSSIAQDEVVVSSILDLGSGSHSSDFAVTFITNGWATAPVAGDTINLFAAFGTSTTELDGGGMTVLPTDTGTGTAVQAIVNNLQFVSSAVGTSTTAEAIVQTSSFLRSVFRYLVFVVENKASSTDNLSATSVKIVVTPVPPEIQ